MRGLCSRGRRGAVLRARIASLERWLLSRVDLVGVITPGFIPEVEAAGVPRDRIVELPNFSRVTPADIGRDEARRHLGWDPDRYLVVHTGNMGMKQGLDVVVETARLAESAMPDVDFVLVGDGNQRTALEQQTAGLANVRMLPPFNDDDFPYVLAAADQLLLCERDGVANMALPSKLTAYTAARRPIIAAVMAEGLSAQAIDDAGIGHVVRPPIPAACWTASAISASRPSCVPRWCATRSRRSRRCGPSGPPSATRRSPPACWRSADRCRRCARPKGSSAQRNSGPTSRVAVNQ